MLSFFCSCPFSAGDVFDGVLFCAVLFSHEISCIRSETKLSQFLRISLPTFPGIRDHLRACVSLFCKRETSLAPRLLNFFMLNSTEHEIFPAHKF